MEIYHLFLVFPILRIAYLRLLSIQRISSMSGGVSYENCFFFYVKATNESDKEEGFDQIKGNTLLFRNCNLMCGL